MVTNEFKCMRGKPNDNTFFEGVGLSTMRRSGGVSRHRRMVLRPTHEKNEAFTLPK